MTWQKIRSQHPHCWVLIEALSAFTENGQRVTPTLQLISDFGLDWHGAWELYKRLHHADKFREYYVVHTEQEVLNIGVIDAFGQILG